MAVGWVSDGCRMAFQLLSSHCCRYGPSGHPAIHPDATLPVAGLTPPICPIRVRVKESIETGSGFGRDHHDAGVTAPACMSTMSTILLSTRIRDSLQRVVVAPCVNLSLTLALALDLTLILTLILTLNLTLSLQRVVVGPCAPIPVDRPSVVRREEDHGVVEHALGLERRHHLPHLLGLQIGLGLGLGYALSLRDATTSPTSPPNAGHHLPQVILHTPSFPYTTPGRHLVVQEGHHGMVPPPSPVVDEVEGIVVRLGHLQWGVHLRVGRRVREVTDDGMRCEVTMCVAQKRNRGPWEGSCSCRIRVRYVSDACRIYRVSDRMSDRVSDLSQLSPQDTCTRVSARVSDTVLDLSQLSPQGTCTIQ